MNEHPRVNWKSSVRLERRQNQFKTIGTASAWLQEDQITGKIGKSIRIKIQYYQFIIKKMNQCSNAA